MSTQHHFKVKIKWTGNKGTGTSGYTDYERSHEISSEGKQSLAVSSDPIFRGDGSKYNPEDLFLYTLSSCHMLWYLHLCADAGIIVLNYEDQATGTLSMLPEGGRFTEATLHPVVTVKDESMKVKAIELHHAANKKCFIANSVNFKVEHDVTCIVAT